MDITQKIAIAFVILLTLGLFYAVTTIPESIHNGEIVKDQNGKYYKLESGCCSEKYRLIEIDTAKFNQF